MKLRHLGISALMSAALVTASSANAGSYSFDFLANDTSYEVSGTFGTADVLNIYNGYDITSIAGSVFGTGGGLISSLIPNPNQPNNSNCCTANGWYITFDNNLYPNATPHLDLSGVAFSAGGNNWNLFNNNGPYELFSSTGVNVGVVDVQGTMTLTPVPEPETYAMLLAGLGLLGLMARRRKQKTA